MCYTKMVLMKDIGTKLESYHHPLKNYVGQCVSYNQASSTCSLLRLNPTICLVWWIVVTIISMFAG